MAFGWRHEGVHLKYAKRKYFFFGIVSHLNTLAAAHSLASDFEWATTTAAQTAVFLKWNFNCIFSGICNILKLCISLFLNWNYCEILIGFLSHWIGCKFFIFFVILVIQKKCFFVVAASKLCQPIFRINFHAFRRHFEKGAPLHRWSRKRLQLEWIPNWIRIGTMTSIPTFG